MKHFIIILIILKAYNCYSQKIIYDKKDPFTNQRTIVTEQLPIFNSGLIKLAEVSGSLTLGDSIVIILGFISNNLGYIKTESADSIKKECLIKLTNGEIVKGSWGSTSDIVGVLSSPKQLSSFVFTKEDLMKLVLYDVTDIKFLGSNNHGLQFEVSSKHKSNILKIANLIKKYL